MLIVLTTILQTRGTFTRFWDQGCRRPSPRKVQGLFPNLVNGRPSLNTSRGPYSRSEPHRHSIGYRNFFDQPGDGILIILGHVIVLTAKRGGMSG